LESEYLEYLNIKLTKNDLLSLYRGYSIKVVVNDGQFTKLVIQADLFPKEAEDNND
jgi:hypothetical protein